MSPRRSVQRHTRLGIGPTETCKSSGNAGFCSSALSVHYRDTRTPSMHGASRHSGDSSGTRRGKDLVPTRTNVACEHGVYNSSDPFLQPELERLRVLSPGESSNGASPPTYVIHQTMCGTTLFCPNNPPMGLMNLHSANARRCLPSFAEKSPDAHPTRGTTNILDCSASSEHDCPGDSAEMGC